MFDTEVIRGKPGVSDEGEETHWSRLTRHLTDHHHPSPRYRPRYEEMDATPECLPR